MGLGGPVWHASAAALPGWPSDAASLHRFALAALDGVGDKSLGEWDEWTGYAWHVRRRLSAEEQWQVGEVRDIRGTPEAEKRLARVLPYVLHSPQGMRVLAAETAGDTSVPSLYVYSAEGRSA